LVENVISATGEQIPYALPGGMGLLSKAGRPLQSFMQVARPTVGAGIGVGAAREYIPDSPTAEMAGALVGSATPMVTRPLMSWMQPQGRKLVESAMKIPPRSVPKEIRDQAVDTFIKEDISLSEKGLRKVGNLIDDINTEIDDTIKAIPQTKTVKTVIPGKTVTYTIPGKIVKTESSKFAKNEGDPLWRMKSGGDLEEFKRMYTPMAQRPPKDIITQLPDEIITNKIGTIDTTEAAARIDDLKTFYRKLPKDVADEFINVLDDWQAKLASDGFITPEKAQEMKKAIYVLNRKHYGELKSAQVEAHKAFARGLKEELVKQNPQLATLNARDSALINLEEILEKALNRTRNYDIIRMGDTLMAMTGGVVGGYPGAGLAAMLKRIFEDPQAKAALGKAMAKAGKKPIPVPFVRAGIASGALQNYRNANE
jgi:hypothetical protein